MTEKRKRSANNETALLACIDFICGFCLR
jgi:hypothetical protein